MEATMKTAMGYIEARKQFDGWCLFFRGTRNEVYPASVRFVSAQAARRAYQLACEQGRIDEYGRAVTLAATL
jgi:hypothetical protein